jgi:hypothetical protein
MTSRRLSVFAISALLCVGGAVLGNKEEDTTLKDIAGYRQWDRVTGKPIPVENSFSPAA